MNGSSTKDRLVREADEAFAEGDRARCVHVIAQLYYLLDGGMGLGPVRI